jgi:ATP-dependent DNA helicase RecG
VDTTDLAPLLAPLTSLHGIGPALAERFARAVRGGRVLDLLFHLPDSYIDRSAHSLLRDVVPGTIGTVTIQVVRHEPPTTAKQPWRVVIGDESGFAEITLFSRPGQPPAALTRLPPGARLLISGKAEVFNGKLSFPHPDFVLPAERAGELAAYEPVWRLTAGLATFHLRRAIKPALERLPDLPEWHDPLLLKREDWPGFGAALRMLHAPDAVPGMAPRLRLAYDEVLAQQVAYGLSRRRGRADGGRALIGDGALRRQALERFGHAPTDSQAAALAEIDADMAAPRRMLRLLQGDVGSGKTLVALLAMLTAAEAGYQAALMAPTEVLARQHLRTFRKLAPVATELLAGSLKAQDRRRVLDGLESGRVRLVVGTHALFQSGVVFRDLALAVIDEQHRFGVDQRLTLSGKGSLTDLLIMTATPIPRTLLLAQWGEMDVTRLTGKPAGRAPIRTTLHSMANLAEVVDAVGRALAAGNHVYWVCPLVTESEQTDIAAAEERYAAFRERFGSAVGLVHGRQDSALRERHLAAFASGRTPLLVATTVVEVGVDVAAATVMVIDHAERFGLAQLHQLRGRVGRGSVASYCLLLHDDTLAEAARVRLTLLRDTDDGFVIADEDFRLRGPGEALGVQQSGQPLYRMAAPEQQERLLHLARRDADHLLTLDPELATARGTAIRTLLELFGRSEAARTLKAG